MLLDALSAGTATYLSRILDRASATSVSLNMAVHFVFAFVISLIQILWFDLVWVFVLNATFNNISVISWWSVLLVNDTAVSEEYH